MLLLNEDIDRSRRFGDAAGLSIGIDIGAPNREMPVDE
jgi:hypothetical protein